MPGMLPLYAGFFIYGIGMGGTAVLAETIWADFFGRISLGKIRGMGSLVTSLFSAGGPPFFGLLSDYTESYYLSFNIFIGMLFTSAVLSLFLRPPVKSCADRATTPRDNSQARRDTSARLFDRLAVCLFLNFKIRARARRA